MSSPLMLPKGLSLDFRENTPKPMAPTPAPMPSAAPMAAPAPPPMVPKPGIGSNIGDALQKALPVIATIIARKQGGPLASTAVMQGFAKAQATQREEEAARLKTMSEVMQNEQDWQYKLAQLDQDKNRQLSSFVTDIIGKTADITDPAEYARVVELADKTAQQAFGTPEGFVRSQMTFSDTKALNRKKSEAQKLLDSLQKKWGQQFDALSESGATVEFDGQRVPIRDVIALAGVDVQSAKGEPVKVETPHKFSAPDEMLVNGKKTTIVRDENGRPWYYGGGKRIRPVEDDATVEIYTKPPSSVSAGDVERIAEGIINGNQPPVLTGLYRLSGPVRAYLEKQGFDLTRAMQDWTATQRMLATLNGTQQTRLRQAAQTAYDSLDIIDELNTKLTQLVPRSRVKVMNRGALTLAKNGAFGDEAASVATLLEAQLADLTSELGNVYMGGNSPTDHALSLAGKNLSSDWTEKTLRDAIGLARKNLRIRLNSIGLAAPIGGRAENAYAPETPSGESASGMVLMEKPDGTRFLVAAKDVAGAEQFGAKRVKK